MAILKFLFLALFLFSGNPEVTWAQSSGSGGNSGTGGIDTSSSGSGGGSSGSKAKTSGITSLSGGLYAIVEESTKALDDAVLSLQNCLFQFGQVASEALGNIVQIIVDTGVVVPQNVIGFVFGYWPTFLGGEVLRKTHNKTKGCIKTELTPEFVKELVQISVECLEEPTIGKPVKDLKKITGDLNEAVANLPGELNKIGQADDIIDMGKKIGAFGVKTGKFGVDVGLPAIGFVGTLGTGIPGVGTCIIKKVVFGKTPVIVEDAVHLGVCVIM